MSNWMKSARSWLGLGNDPYYEDEYGDPDYDYDDGEDYYDPRRPVRVRRRRPAPPGIPLRSRSARRRPVSRGLGRRRWGRAGHLGARARRRSRSPRGVVRPLPSASKPQIVSPTNFNDVQQVADWFKHSQPVIVNLQGVDRDLSRRLIDFASGLCYGLEGNMERVADQRVPAHAGRRRGVRRRSPAASRERPRR